MKTIWFGTLGFLLYLIYDYNSVRLHLRILQILFGAGSLCVAASAVWQLADALHYGENCSAVRILSGCGAAVFFVLLIYTLFFALPFSGTYVEENRPREAFTEGVYALCRHPGVLWYSGLFLCLWAMDTRLEAGGYFILMILWNIFYVVVQDLWTFPKTFINYGTYQKSTPFLIPNKDSVHRCVAYFRTRR